MPCAPAQCPPRQPILRQICALALLLCAAFPARADQFWTVHALGFKVGEFRLAVNETSSRYAGRAKFQTTGLADLLAGVRLDLSARGRLANGSPSPLFYEGDIHTGSRQARTRVDFTTTPPRALETSDQPASPIPPASLKSALDPMTLLWQTLKDRPAATCPPPRRHFDGTRVAALRFSKSTRTGETLTCDGTYQRLHGYSAKELSERTSAPVSITYQKRGPLWRATRLTAETRRIGATLIRRD